MSVARYHHDAQRGRTEPHDGNDGSHRGLLFEAKHWARNVHQAKEYPPHKANFKLPHESIMFAAVRYHQKFLTLRPADYEICKDFGAVYTALASRAPTSKGRANMAGERRVTRQTRKSLPEEPHKAALSLSCYCTATTHAIAKTGVDLIAAERARMIC